MLFLTITGLVCDATHPLLCSDEEIACISIDLQYLWMQHSAEECRAVGRSGTAGGEPSVSKYSSGWTNTAAAAAAAAIINGRRTSQLIKRLPFPVPPPPVSLRLNCPHCLAAPSPRVGHGFPQRSSLSSCCVLSCHHPQTLSWGHGYIKTTQQRPDFVTLSPHPTSWEMVRMWGEWQPCLWWLVKKKKEKNTCSMIELKSQQKRVAPVFHPGSSLNCLLCYLRAVVWSLCGSSCRSSWKNCSGVAATVL